MSRHSLPRTMGCVIVATFVVALPALGSDSAPGHTETQQFAPSGRVWINMRAGDLKIVKGADEHHIVLSYSATRNGTDITDRVKYRFEVYGDEAEIRLKAPLNNVDFRVEIQVPSPADLKVRMLAGDLTVEGVEGNKDVELHFGDLAINGVHQASYRVLDASAGIGDVEGFPSGTHGWLGQSGQLRGSGEYRLHAHVGAGDVKLKFD